RRSSWAPRTKPRTFLSKTKVENDRAVFSDHHVSRFEITVDQALCVNSREARRRLASDLAKFIRTVAALSLAPTDVRVECLAVDVLHHQDRAPGAGRQIVNPTDVRMTHRTCQQELLPQGFVI